MPCKCLINTKCGAFKKIVYFYYDEQNIGIFEWNNNKCETKKLYTNKLLTYDQPNVNDAAAHRMNKIHQNETTKFKKKWKSGEKVEYFKTIHEVQRQKRIKN